MSTANQFTCRTGFFPFCLSQATPPSSLSDYDSIDLLEVSGDQGFSEAMRIFWLIEEMSFSPQGYADQLVGGIPSVRHSWDKTIDIPADPATDFSATAKGAWVGVSGSRVSIVGASPAQPGARVCCNGLLLESTHTYRIGASSDQGADIFIHLAYSSSRWRLYYKIYFFKNVGTGGNMMRIANPNNPFAAGDAMTSSGTFSLLGYTASWESWEIGLSNPSNWALGGFGLSATETLWTF